MDTPSPPDRRRPPIWLPANRHFRRSSCRPASDDPVSILPFVIPSLPAFVIFEGRAASECLDVRSLANGSFEACRRTRLRTRIATTAPSLFDARRASKTRANRSRMGDSTSVPTHRRPSRRKRSAAQQQFSSDVPRPDRAIDPPGGTRLCASGHFMDNRVGGRTRVEH